MQAVADFIHNIGMKSGLYTAKGPHTCQKRAASCLHEEVDAKNWAAWGVDYVRERWGGGRGGEHALCAGRVGGWDGGGGVSGGRVG